MKSDFQGFLDNNHRIIAKVCRIYTGLVPMISMTIIRNALCSLWRSFDTFRGASKLSTWTYRVCLNVCLSQLRSKKRTIPTENREIPDVVDEDSALQEERVQELYKAIKLLRESDRAIILLYLEEKSYKEMAEILGITVTNVGAKVNRVKAQLKKIIDERFGH